MGISRAAASIIGVIAGLVGVYHGYNETLHGSTATNGILINAIGPSCQGSSCFPAMTVVPNFYATGLLAIIFSLLILVAAVAFVQGKHGGLWLIGLSMVQLLFGGGFLPPALGIVAGIVGTRIRPNEAVPAS